MGTRRAILFENVDMSELKLVLEGQWYALISAGIKREEYREVTPFWMKRLLVWYDGAPLEEFYATDELFREKMKFALDWLGKGSETEPIRYKHDAVTFYHGYSSKRPSMSWRIDSIQIGEGKPEWGAKPGKEYFVIKLGERL